MRVLTSIIAVGAFLFSSNFSPAQTPNPRGDWPLTRGGLWRSNRAMISGNIQDLPEVAWRYPIGAGTGNMLEEDLDGDGIAETYAAENWRVVRRDAPDQVLWRSDRISRQFFLGPAFFLP